MLCGRLFLHTMYVYIHMERRAADYIVLKYLQDLTYSNRLEPQGVPFCLS